jgi:hypothetical protein
MMSNVGTVRPATYTMTMKTVIRLTIATVAFASAMGINVSVSHAFGDAPWCAVTEVGDGEVYWDCQYRTIEECVPNVIAGNRGFCNVNPYGPGPGANGTTTQPRRHKGPVAPY